MGPRRYVRPGLSPENLPTIDIILVSHNHYDHLDSAFIEPLVNKDDIQVFVPLKLKSFFSERDYQHVHELDWYEADAIGNIRFPALPTVHLATENMASIIIRRRKKPSPWAEKSTRKPYWAYIGVQSICLTRTRGNLPNDLRPPRKWRVIPLKTFGYLKLEKPEYCLAVKASDGSFRT